MGIKNLNQLIKECFFYIPKNQFRGHRVAVDFMIFWHKFWSRAAREVVMELPLPILLEEGVSIDEIFARTLEAFRLFLHEMLVYGMLPVIIFEGKSFPLKKEFAGARRQSSRNRLVERKEEYTTVDIANASQKQIQEYRSLLANTTHFPMGRTVQEVSLLLQQTGIPYLKCHTEAEHLATALCKEGYVTAVYTTDTDVLPLGAPLMLFSNGTEEDPEAGVFRAVRHRDILRYLSLNHASFVDLCILCETDYNQRISGVGEKKALRYIQEHRSLENVIEHVILPLKEQREKKAVHEPTDRRLKEAQQTNPEQLQVEACRTIFNSYPVHELCTFEEGCIHPKVHDVPESNYLLDTMRTIVQNMKTIPVYDYP